MSEIPVFVRYLLDDFTLSLSLSVLSIIVAPGKRAEDASLERGKGVCLPSRIEEGEASSFFPWGLEVKMEGSFSSDPGGLWKEKGN